MIKKKNFIGRGLFYIASTELPFTETEMRKKIETIEMITKKKIKRGKESFFRIYRVTIGKKQSKKK